MKPKTPPRLPTELPQKTESPVTQAGIAGRDLTQFAAAIEELAHSSGDIGSQVRKADDLADDASASAAPAGTGVKGLKKSSTEIGQVLGLISTVARQTNLLALTPRSKRLARARPDLPQACAHR